MKKVLAIISLISVISILAILLLIVCRKDSLTPTERYLLKNCKVDRANTNMDNQSIERVESLASCVMSWKPIGALEERIPIDISYPWPHVALSMLEYPDKVIFSNDTCVLCGNKSLVEIYFHSPLCTWEKLCGTAGNMTICTECKKQLIYRVTLMN